MEFATEPSKLTNKFDYNKAFSRNLGWLSIEEQELLRNKKIAIPGMGGVGGHHLHTLIRIGVGKFHIADFDEFEVHNFNRQIGATVSSLGEDKVQVMKDIALDINPEAEIKTFPDGVFEKNYVEFLDGVDLILDSLDVYVLDERIKLFEYAAKKGIPVISAAPLGMGTSVIAFHPKKMSFGKYFNMKVEMDDQNKLCHFLAGMAPKMLHKNYLVAPEHVDIPNGKAPSLHLGVLSATSAIGTTALKILLNRGEVLWAPRGFQTDFYTNKTKKFWRPFGNKNPFQKLIIRLIKKIFYSKDGLTNQN